MNLAPEREERPRLERACSLLSICLPWIVGVLAISQSPRFADDVALTRAFGGLPVGLEGLLSAALSNTLALLPIGTLLFRAAAASVIGLSLGSFVTYRVCYGLLRESAGRGDRLAAPLSLLAALSAALGPSWVLEGSAPGGHALAAALALSALAVALRAPVAGLGLRRALVLGALLGATLIESRTTALGLAGALFVRLLLCRELPAGRAVLAFTFGLAALVVLPATLALTLYLVPTPHSGLATGLFGHGWSLGTIPIDRSAALDAWLAEMGLFGLGLSVSGLAVGLLRPSLRASLLPLGVFLVYDALFAANALDPSQHDALSGVRLVALSALGAASALALASAIAWLSRARIAFAYAASVLLMVYGFTLVLVSAEDSARAAEVRSESTTELWTDEALASLPARSAVLVRSKPILFRLLAARATRGSRPDVLLVPLDLLERGGVRAELFAREEGLIALVREMLLAGRPSEYALSALADARPTFVELDPRWDPRIYSHFVPQAFFTAFRAQPLGRSDRLEQLSRGEGAFGRVLKRVRQRPGSDPATEGVLSGALVERAVLLTALGDREPAARVVDDLLELRPGTEIGLELKQRLKQPGKGRIDVSGLGLLSLPSIRTATKSPRG